MVGLLWLARERVWVGWAWLWCSYWLAVLEFWGCMVVGVSVDSCGLAVKGPGK